MDARAARFFLCLTTVLMAFSLTAQDRHHSDDEAGYVRSHYTKFEYRIPMRDGIRLYTAVYAPKDHSQTYPIMMLRTPYSVGPYGVDNYPEKLGPSDTFEKDGFIFVYQDVRGRYESEGVLIDNPPAKNELHGDKDVDPTTDTYDTIDWLVKHVGNNNGKVGTWGVSYPGMFAAFGLIRSHPALKAVSPQAPMGDVGNGDDAYHNGAFFLAANFGFYTGFTPRGLAPERPKDRDSFDYGTPDEYDFYLRMGPIANADAMFDSHHNVYWTDTLEHPNYDEFWVSRALAPHMTHITPAVLLVGGWFDAEDLSGPLKIFRAAEKSGGEPSLTLAMGPWRHGGWAGGDGDHLGNLNFASKTGEFFRDEIEFPFFKKYLKGGADAKMPKAWLFETGRNEWRKFEAWPPAEAKRRALYLAAGGKVLFDAPQDGEGFDEYVSDPAKPVPSTEEIGEGMPGDYMTRDQRFASRRTDVLTYESAPLEEDMTIAGPITPSLGVSTSGSDSDFDVKLIDVYPDDYRNLEQSPHGLQYAGYEQLVRGEPFRGKFRHSMAAPEAFVPGARDRIEFAMPDVLHTFRTGHRIMVQIQSTWFPLTDRNPQKFCDIPTAKAADFQKAMERVYWGGKDGSRVDVLVIP